MKRVLWALVSMALIALIYYLVFRPFEFAVNFKTNTLPGDVITTLRIWNRSLDKSKILEVDSLERVTQSIVWKNRSYVYTWRFKMLNDTTTAVTIRISEPGRGLVNKILVPFTDPPIEKDANEIARVFYEVLKTHLEITKVKITGETMLDSVFCACTTLETDQIEKANGMMKDFPLLTTFVNAFKLDAKGRPMVSVREWSHNAGTLKFDFCFPIIPGDSLPDVKQIFYKTFPVRKALRAEYHGNYITSDRAWYALLQHAHVNGYQVTGMPVEYFNDNPNTGMNEMEWRADVYLPIE